MKCYLIKFSHYLFTVDSQTAKVREPNLPENQISVNLRFIESTSVQKKTLILNDSDKNLVFSQECDFC